MRSINQERTMLTKLSIDSYKSIINQVRERRTIWKGIDLRLTFDENKDCPRILED